MEKNDMITRFNEIYEKVDLSDIAIDVENKNDELIKRLVDELSIVIYKRKGKFRSLRITKVSGSNQKEKFKDQNFIYSTNLLATLSNNDTIGGTFSSAKDGENNISIKINDKIVYDLDSKKFTDETLIDKMVGEYKKQLEKEWKIRN
jgi:hypothetical protein